MYECENQLMMTIIGVSCLILWTGLLTFKTSLLCWLQKAIDNMSLVSL